ncbi:MAG: PAS domain S-box protein [Chitinophagaceae bacterium]|nr:PAS domain S-box protein [Chitinophagaceae bacterium]
MRTPAVSATKKTRNKPVVEKEACLDAVVEHFDGFVWSINREFQYIVLNTAIRKKIKELTGKEARTGDKMTDLFGLLDPSKARVWKKVCQRGFAGERQRVVEKFSIQGHAVFYEMSIIPVYNGDEVTGLSCFVRDLTTEKLTEQRAQMNEIRFRSLIEKGTDIIVVVGSEGRITYTSPSVERYFGITDAENLGKNAFDYIHPEDLPRLVETFMEVLNSPGKPISVQARAQSKEGRHIWVEGIVTNLLGVEGVNGVVCNFRDVTERKEIEKKIMQASIDAQEREREEIGRELHDNVNQILTTARLYLDCIHEAPTGKESIIRRSSEIITTAIEEIRKLSRSMTQSFHKEVGLKLSIEDLLENIRQLPEGIQVGFDFFLPGEPALDDKLKVTIFRIVQEQLNNVLKHAGATTVDVSVREDGPMITLCISDNGRGFDPWKKREGIGINNIINRAEISNGQVTIASAPGKGCVLSVDFRLS